MINNYKTEPPIYNGNIGIIRSIYYDDLLDEDIMLIDFKGIGEVKVPRDAWNNIELGYAITVHKSQGSEYPVVIIPMYYCAPMLMTRNLLYTAVTRARRMVILVGREDIARTMVDNNRQSMRYTGLAYRLRGE